MTATATRRRHPFTRAELDVVEAWCTVLSTIEPANLRMATVIALPAFKGADIIECRSCASMAVLTVNAANALRAMTVTGAFRHAYLAQGSLHQLALNWQRIERVQ